MRQKADEIIKRIHTAKKRQRARRMRVMLSCVCLLLVSLVAAISAFSGAGTTAQTYSVMGAFLLGPQTGGYVLVAVIAFVIGILVAELGRYFRKRDQKSTEKEQP